ncbi:hypothetical protein F5ESL0233_04460 [Lactobacillus sp. ESL0233]|uniref:hypothetical protein n=1 Tax=Lactobacillus sp. ESL0233 TaxID=2069354 RepID=UPI000EFB4318|nr:hypothetical protein [Lactobacillus sp. ESL0233]RMC41580.1 hypothetical protein F5ESL0233_04460 [Lactobacillus sp. ESL0233]
MKKQETVFEALKDIYHHLKEWSDPSSALKKGNLLPLAIVIFCFPIPNAIFLQKNDFRSGLIALVSLIIASADIFIYQHLLKKSIDNGMYTQQIKHSSMIVSGLRGLVIAIAGIEVIQSFSKVKINVGLVVLLGIAASAIGVGLQKLFINHHS